MRLVNVYSGIITKLLDDYFTHKIEYFEYGDEFQRAKKVEALIDKAITEVEEIIRDADSDIDRELEEVVQIQKSYQRKERLNNIIDFKAQEEKEKSIL